MVGIGFFAPFPLALMIPFMAGQSLAMGEAFGKGFQYGKRKISSMSNEEFNALNFQQLSESIATDYKVMIPSMKESLKASDELQRAVFDALGKIILTLPDAVAGMFSDSTNRAGLDATTTETSFSELGSQITEVRAGSGLGDIRKQQEQSTQQTAEELRINARNEKLRNDALARFQNRNPPPVVETFVPQTQKKAALSERTVLNNTIKDLNVRLSAQKRIWNNLQLTIGKYNSESRAILAFTKNTPDKTMTARYYFLQGEIPKLENQKRASSKESTNIQVLIRKTQDLLGRTR